MPQKLQFTSSVDGFIPGFGEFTKLKIVTPSSDAEETALLATGHFEVLNAIEIKATVKTSQTKKVGE